MNIMITEAQLQKIIQESKMQAWQYLDDIDWVVKKIYTEKETLLNSNRWMSFPFIHGHYIDVANEERFTKDLPKQSKANGICCGSRIRIKMKQETSLKDLYATITHELEHLLDDDNDYFKIPRDSQLSLQKVAYTLGGNTSGMSQLEMNVKYIIYHFWIHTERNAFVSQSFLQYPESIEGQISRALNLLDYIKDTDTNEYANFWKSLSFILTNAKNGKQMAKDINNPAIIKKHFLQQSYHKIKNYGKTLIKKLRYAKMNNLDIGASKRERGLMLPSNRIYWYMSKNGNAIGSFTKEEMKKMLQDNTINKQTLVNVRGDKNWLSLWQCPELYDYNSDFQPEPPKRSLQNLRNKISSFFKR